MLEWKEIVLGYSCGWQFYSEIAALNIHEPEGNLWHIATKEEMLAAVASNTITLRNDYEYLLYHPSSLTPEWNNTMTSDGYFMSISNFGGGRTIAPKLAAFIVRNADYMDWQI